jgi:hypothetical protein
MTAVEFYRKHLHALVSTGKTEYKTEPEIFEKAKEMEKQEKIKILRSLVYSVCLGDDVEDVEEWLKEHELNK